MPSARQNMVDPEPTEKRLAPLSSADNALLMKMFPNSPMYTREVTNIERIKYYQDNLLEGPINDGGHYFGEFDPNFAGAPDYADVETGGAGLPASPWVPNPVSPGPGNTNASAQPDPPEGFGTDQGSQGSAGEGSRLSPKTSSELIAQQKIGDYVLKPLSRAYVVGG